jgi:hypothetical protein
VVALARYSLLLHERKIIFDDVCFYVTIDRGTVLYLRIRGEEQFNLETEVC